VALNELVVGSCWRLEFLSSFGLVPGLLNAGAKHGEDDELEEQEAAGGNVANLYFFVTDAPGK